MLDMLFRGGVVHDGSGAPGIVRDIGVAGGVITYIGRPPNDDAIEVAPDAAETVDISGLVLAPGFIDIHTHSDLTVLADSRAQSKVLQGVTTEVVGNCSFSAFPAAPEHIGALEDHLSRLGGPTVPVRWSDLDGYARELELAPTTLNVASFVGHGALRIAAMDDPFGPASATDIARMCELLEAALEQGAMGMTTGLTHTPSSHGTREEVWKLAAVCARHDRLYATHARSAYGQEFAAVDEAIEVAERTGVRLQFSHAALNDPANWGRAADVISAFEAAASRGVSVGYDVYPYTASSSALVQYLPEWVQAGGSAGLRDNSRIDGWRERALADISTGWYGGIPWHWDRIDIVEAAGHEQIEGMAIADIAKRWRRSPEEVLLDLCVELGSAAQAVLHYRVEEDVQSFMAHPLGIIASDGNALELRGGGRPHPRSYGTFPRVIGRYVRELGTLTLAEAVNKLTAEPAARLGLRDRGLIAVGMAADLVVFDSATVADQASFEYPRRPPLGLERTVVAGQTVALGGEIQSARPGRFLRATTAQLRAA